MQYECKLCNKKQRKPSLPILFYAGLRAASSCPHCFPVFYPQVGNPFKFLFVVRHKHRIKEKGVRSNEKVHGADRRSVLLKPRANLSIEGSCLARPIEKGRIVGMILNISGHVLVCHRRIAWHVVRNDLLQFGSNLGGVLGHSQGCQLLDSAVQHANIAGGAF